MDGVDSVRQISGMKSSAQVYVVVWDGVELLDMAGPAEVFAVADGGQAFDVQLVASRPGPVTTQSSVRLLPQHVLHADLPAPAVLVVPGGASEEAVADARLMELLPDLAARTPLVLSVCTGAIVLARAGGLAEVSQATTWHGALDRLRGAVSGLRVRGDVRWVDAGAVVTSAGVSAGIDAALHVVDRLCGSDVRMGVERHMEYEGFRPDRGLILPDIRSPAPPRTSSDDPPRTSRPRTSRDARSLEGDRN